MKEQFIRSAMLLGEEGIARLQRKRVAVFGIGGVGGHVVEALVRSGLGSIDIIDDDIVAPSNLNRQLIATFRTLGMPKVEAMEERILSINPDCRVTAHRCFYLPETAGRFDFAAYDYVVDAVDTVTAKIDLVMRACGAGTPVISSMGAGNKLDPAAFEVADIYHTSVCPLAKVMRCELKKRGVKGLKVVYSKEEPKKMNPLPEDGENCGENGKEIEGAARKRAVPGSVAFVPAAAGLILAGEVIKDLAFGAGNGNRSLR